MTGTIYGLYCRCGDCEIRKPKLIRYVGQTKQRPALRLQGHKHGSSYRRHQDYSTAKALWVRKHGVENIELVILESDVRDLNRAEKEWVKRLRTYNSPHGLNMTIGGYDGAGKKGASNNSAKLTEANVREIIEKIGVAGSRHTSYSLAQDYGVTKTLILKIDHGDLWPDVPRPYGLRVLNRNRRMTITRQIAEELRESFDPVTMTMASFARDKGYSFGVVSNVLNGTTWKS